jgi:hypothetical protein
MLPVLVLVPVALLQLQMMASASCWHLAAHLQGRHAHQLISTSVANQLSHKCSFQT